MQNSASAMTGKLNDIIAENRKNIESLTEENATIKKYINSLETEANMKSKEINEKNRYIREIEEKLDLLKGEEKKLADTIAEERKKT